MPYANWSYRAITQRGITMSSIALSFNNVDLVSIDNGQPMTNSKLVAEKFGKRHANVLQAIDNIECSDTFKQLNFKLVMETMTYVDKNGFSKSKQTKRIGHVEMTKNGFVFLVMGFTGKQAAKFKEDYINEFDRMATTLNANALSTIREVEYLTLRIEDITKNLSAAGSFLSVGGKQTKPALVSVLNDRLAKLQPLLTGFENEIKQLSGK